MDVERQRVDINGESGKNLHGGSVSSIIKQLESSKHPFRVKPPPVPPAKPSSSTTCAPSHCHDVNQPTGAHPTEKNVKYDEEHEEIYAGRIRRFSSGDKSASSGDLNANSSGPFRYVIPNDVISKMGTLTSARTNLDSLPPPPPPRSNFVNGIGTTNGKTETKGETKKGTWRRIDGQWMNITENARQSSPMRTVTNGNGEMISRNDSRFSVCTTDSTSTHSSDGISESPMCQLDVSGSPSCSYTSKPALTQSQYIRKSSDGRNSSNDTTARRLRPVLPAKPAVLRKYAPSSTISIVSTVSTTSSIQSISDDADSDAENEHGANCAGRISNGNGENSAQGDPASSAPATPTLTRAQKAFRCAEEFLTSEKSYVKTLEDLSENFPRFMKSQSDSAGKLLVEPDIPAIIANSLHELRELHRTLVADFETRLENWDSDPRLADILLEKGPFLKMSIRFLQRKEELAMQVLTSCKRYQEFNAALTLFEREHFDGLHLVHKLDSVHQRLCRYPLLLTSYLKYLSPDSVEYRIAERAKEFINNITLELEESLKEQDGTRTLCELYRRIIPQSRFEVIEPGRKLMKEGPILKYSRKERQSRHLILFTDVLLCCAPVVAGSNMLRLRHVIQLKDPASSISARGDQETDSIDSGWEFIIKGRQKSIIFVAECAAEGKAWVKAIENAIRCSQRKLSEVISPRLSRFSIDEQQETSSTMSSDPPPSVNCPVSNVTPSALGASAPVWTPDQRVTMCQCCGEAFTAIRRRRHHCRACGFVICDDCSGKAPLEYLKFKEERVCPNCYAILYDRTKDPTNLEEICSKTNQAPAVLLALFVAPKNRYNNQDATCDAIGTGNGTGQDPFDDEDDAILIKSYLWLRNRQGWRRYWTVFREPGVIEFYKAINDRKCDQKIVLLGWQAKAVNKDEFMFELFHTNQFKGDEKTVGAGCSEDAHLRYCLKSENADCMDRWLSELEGFFVNFVS